MLSESYKARWIVLVLLICATFGVVGACHLHATPLEHGDATHDSHHHTSAFHCLVNSACLLAVLPAVGLVSVLLLLREFYAITVMAKRISPVFPLFKPPRYAVS